MKDLLNYIIKGLLGETEFEIDEQTNEGRTELVLKLPKESIGLIIGKGGTTIKSIRNIMRVRSTLENTSVYLNVAEL